MRRSLTRSSRHSNNDLSQEYLEQILKFGTVAGVVGEVKPSRSLVQRVRAKAWILFDDPYSSGTARALSVLITLAIITSVVAIVLETIPSLEHRTSIWRSIEITCVVLFTIEFIFRLGSTPDLKGFWTDPLNWIDLLAILPFYIELAAKDLHGVQSVRGLRLFRVVRIFKLSRYVTWIKIFNQVVASSRRPLLMLLFIMSLLVIMLASAIYFAERGIYDKDAREYRQSDGTRSEFQSIPEAIYWGIITVTTVGYGDLVPRTLFGKCIASFACLFGILVLAIPVSVISQNFTSASVHNHKTRQNKRNVLRRIAQRARKLQKKNGQPTLTKFDLQELQQAVEEAGPLETDPINRRIQTVLDHRFQKVMERVEFQLRRESRTLRTRAKRIIRAKMDGSILEPFSEEELKAFREAECEAEDDVDNQPKRFRRQFSSSTFPDSCISNDVYS